MKNTTYIALASLAMDLKRVALGYHNGSRDTAVRFLKEAIKRKNEINKDELQPYLRRFLNDVEEITQVENDDEKAEKSLFLSTLFQNAAVAQTVSGFTGKAQLYER